MAPWGKGEGKNLAKTLTAAAVAKLLPDKKRREIPDAGSPGLRLVIQPSGAKSWALRFRRPDGRTGKLTLGRFDPMTELEGEPTIGGPLTLAAARRLASDIMRQRALGRDVIADRMSAKRRRKSDHEQRATQGFAPAARRFITEYARPQLRSWDTSARLLGFKPSTVEPMKDGLAERWRDKLVSDVTADDVHDLVAENKNQRYTRTESPHGNVRQRGARGADAPQQVFLVGSSAAARNR
jgi:hypothetical protein